MHTLETLSTIRRSDAKQCGSKAACLGELALRGYNVPSCLILPSSVYEEFLVRNGLVEFTVTRVRESVNARAERLVEIEQEILSEFAAGELQDEIRSKVGTWVRQSRADRFAVRSSATNEDLLGASFAGQYDSFLNVDPSEIPHEIIRCFASLFSARAALYRRRKQLCDVGTMAAIVQEMVQSHHAGVVLTQAPYREGTLLIECAQGLCNDVVAGKVAPNRYYVSRSTLTVEHACERYPLDVANVRNVAQQALAIEVQLGGPQDIEYCVVDGVVHILQARPAASV